MSSIAKGKYAYGFCDRTGFRYPLSELVEEFNNGTKTGLRVGKDIADGDHPQNFIGRVRIDDPQSLNDPRPDTAVESLYSFDPVGHEAQYMTTSVGRVTVTTD
jgi:hypothetical protein